MKKIKKDVEWINERKESLLNSYIINTSKIFPMRKNLKYINSWYIYIKKKDYKSKVKTNNDVD